MKRLIEGALALMFLFMTVGSAKAQKLQVLDPDGNPVGYAHILNHAGTVVNMTDLDGTIDLSPFRGVFQGKPAVITHIAFKAQTVNLADAGETQVVTLQDNDFEMTEVAVSPKDYIYVQTYFRLIYMADDTVLYYRAGVVDNAYDVKKKKVSADKHHFSKGRYGLMKFTLDKLMGRTIDNFAVLPSKSTLTANSDAKVTFTQETPDRERISYGNELIGFIVKDREAHRRRTTVDQNVYLRHLWTEKGKSKKLQRMERKKNSESKYILIYQMDDDGNCSVEDFMMKQTHTEFDSYSKMNNKDEHTRIWLEVFSTDRAYVTKRELKERKKANRVEMSYAALRQFEIDHNVPQFVPQIVERINVLMKKKEKLE